LEATKVEAKSGLKPFKLTSSAALKSKVVEKKFQAAISLKISLKRTSMSCSGYGSSLTEGNYTKK